MATLPIMSLHFHLSERGISTAHFCHVRGANLYPKVDTPFCRVPRKYADPRFQLLDAIMGLCRFV